jgi:hypothetical protein
MFRELLKRLFPGTNNRRREPREEVAVGTVEIGGRSYSVRNWSSTGFLAAPFDGAYKEGDSVDIKFQVQVPGQAIRFACKAILVRIDPQSREFAGVFTMMERETRVVVARHFA